MFGGGGRGGLYVKFVDCNRLPKYWRECCTQTPDVRHQLYPLSCIRVPHSFSHSFSLVLVAQKSSHMVGGWVGWLLLVRGVQIPKNTEIRPAFRRPWRYV